VVFAMLINYLLPRERLVHWMDKINLPHRDIQK